MGGLDWEHHQWRIAFFREVMFAAVAAWRDFGTYGVASKAQWFVALGGVELDEPVHGQG